MRHDVERIISTPKFEIAIAVDPHRRYRYRFPFKTRDVEKLKREVALYSHQNPDLMFLYEQVKRPGVVDALEKIGELAVGARNRAFPVTAKIFIRTAKGYSIEKTLKPMHRQVLNADDRIPEARLVQNSGKRYAASVKVKSYAEFDAKFNRLKEGWPDLDVFVVYEGTTMRSYITVLMALAAIVMSVPRLSDLTEMIRKWLGS